MTKIGYEDNAGYRWLSDSYRESWDVAKNRAKQEYLWPATVAPDYAKYNDDGVFADLTNALDGDRTTEYQIPALVAADDSLLIGDAHRTSSIVVKIGTVPNANVSALTLECSDGAGGWLAATIINDGTEAGGISLAQTGRIDFIPHSDMATYAIDGDTAYWVKMTFSANLTALTSLQDLYCICPIHGEWVMSKADPIRDYRESFSGAVGIAPALLGLSMDNSWACNGRRGGAVDVNETNYVAANKEGGGIQLKVIAGGGADNDYTALHWGGNYPIDMGLDPQFTIKTKFLTFANCGFFVGIAGSTNKAAGNNAYTLQDDAIGLYYDTDVDDKARFIIRVGGVSNHAFDTGKLRNGENTAVVKVTATDIVLYLNGTIVTTYSTPANFPTERLQPYFVAISRNAGQAVDALMTDFILYEDWSQDYTAT